MEKTELKINDKQAKKFAILISPLIKGYIKEHAKEFEDFLSEQRKRSNKAAEVASDDERTSERLC